jgi:hypothetical protein
MLDELQFGEIPGSWSMPKGDFSVFYNKVIVESNLKGCDFNLHGVALCKHHIM